METLGTIILAIALFIVGYGIILLLFVKGRRKRGFLALLIGFFLLPAIGASLGGSLAPSKGDSLAHDDRRLEHKDVSLSQEEIAERLRQKEQRAAFQARTAENAGFPDYEIYQKAKAIGLSSYAQYKFAMNPGSMDAHCAWEDKSYAITLEANKRFGESPNGDAFVKKRAWADERQEKLAEETAAALGVEYREMLALADKKNWTARCTAQRAGYPSMDAADAVRASKAEGETGLAAVKRVFDLNLKNGTTPYYAQRKGGEADCRLKSHERMNLIMCRIVGTSHAPQSFFYIIGKTADGKLLAAPMTGASQTRFLDHKAIGADASIFSVARAVGMDTDVTTWRKLFGITE